MAARTADVPHLGQSVVNNTDAIDAVLTARDAVLVALVALGAVPGAEVPSDALDAALAADDDYRAARARFRELHERLRGHPDFFDIESTTNEMVTTAVDVGFRVGSRS
jgi:hypothetical protein